MVSHMDTILLPVDANFFHFSQFNFVNGFTFLPFQKDYEELAENVMNIVDRLVHKTDVRTMFNGA